MVVSSKETRAHQEKHSTTYWLHLGTHILLLVFQRLLEQSKKAQCPALAKRLLPASAPSFLSNITRFSKGAFTTTIHRSKSVLHPTMFPLSRVLVYCTILLALTYFPFPASFSFLRYLAATLNDLLTSPQVIKSGAVGGVASR
jgi:hypothetical protein